jgi:hypothetical protein
MKLHHLPAAAILAALSLGASAQTLKPGLWQVTNKMGGSAQMDQAMAEMQKQMAAMPPEQRKAMQDMMARNGVQMGAGGPGGMSAKMCMTKEMAERNEIPANQGDCKTTSQQRTGNTMKMAFTCASPPSSGEGQFTFVSSEAYTMKMNVRTTVGGKAENVTMDGSGQWLGADCGNIKPMAAPAKK